MYLNEFGKRLHDLMEMEHISKRKLSLAIKADRKSVRLWMEGKNFPKPIALIRLAVYFNVRIDYLLGLEDNICDAVNSFSITEKDIQQRFYKYLTEYMTSSDLTIYALSKKLDIDQKAVTNWFKKGSVPEVSTIIKLGQLMKVSLQELLIGE